MVVCSAFNFQARNFKHWGWHRSHANTVVLRLIVWVTWWTVGPEMLRTDLDGECYICVCSKARITRLTWLSWQEFRPLRLLFRLRPFAFLQVVSTFFSGSKLRGSSFGTCRLSSGPFRDGRRRRPSCSYLCGGSSCGTCSLRSAFGLCEDTYKFIFVSSLQG